MVTINPAQLAEITSLVPARSSRSARRKLAARIESATNPVITALPSGESDDEDAIKRAEDSHAKALWEKRSADIKPAAKEKKKTPKKVEPSAVVAAIRACATALQLAVKPFGKDGNSFVLKLGTIGDFLNTLKPGQTPEARAFIALHKTIAGFVKGDATTTWVFHRSGSFALYSRM